MKKTLWLIVSALMVLFLVMAACGPATTPTTPTVPTTPTTPTTPTAPATPATPATPAEKEAVKPASEVPKYGGTLIEALTSESTSWGPHPTSGPSTIVNQKLWMGDWAKGPAGGYGTNETEWLHSVDRWDQKAGFIAESTKWTFDVAKNEGTIIYRIRQGIHYGLNPALEASRLVNGRELTADDIVYVLKVRATDPQSYVYLTNPELRTANITKTGPWEVTVKVPVADLVLAILRFTASTWFYPPEVFQKYNAMVDWKSSVGTGPFILTEYVPGSQVVYVRNPNYYENDPVGPGKGNQLPYLDGVKRLILPDASTRLAAFRTGKIDTMSSLLWEDTDRLKKQVPALLVMERTSNDGRGNPAGMRTDKAPFNDVRVRRAMIMAIDYEAIRRDYFGSKAQLLTYPHADTKDYHDLYVSLDDPDMPASVKELYIYNTEKAKQLLKEAGYPTGFKTSILISTTTQIDYYSIIKDMWAKVGIDLNLDVRQSAVVETMKTNKTHEALAPHTSSPVTIFYSGNTLQGGGRTNTSMLDDPIINAALNKVRLAMLTDIRQAMKLYREEISKYVLDQAFHIPSVEGYNYTIWWPWLKGYSGEKSVGYDDAIWPQYIWYDKVLKKSMGY